MANDRIGVILAGGESRRMGENKAQKRLAGKRLIDHVIDRLAPQVDRILIAGPNDYDSSYESVLDRADGPRGPAAGLWAALHWLEQNPTDADGFVTAPVDCPFLPDDLVAKLQKQNACAVAKSDDGLQPGFAWWNIERLRKAFSNCDFGKSVPLHELVEACAACKVSFENADAFFNINTVNDLAYAKRLAQKEL